MGLKAFLGWVFIALAALTPVFLWFYLGPGVQELGDYASLTHSLGELAGLVGMTLFALTFLLSTRITFIEDLFGGLDKVYVAHGMLGGTALILILAHPLLLVLKFIPDNVRQAAIYLLPGTHWSVNFGIIALLGMIFLIYLTLYTKIKYNHWKFSHEFLGLVFAFAVLHVFLVRGDASKDYIFAGYYYYAAAVALIGLGGFFYSLFLKGRLFKAAEYRIKAITQKSANTYELALTAEHKPIGYKSGQFVFLRFYNERLTREAHPFSIASKSNHPTLKVVVKALGDFTSRIPYLQVGGRVSVEGPYGRFNYSRKYDKDQVWIAGGIGIAPFIGMAEELADRPDLKNKIHLFYSVRDNFDLVGINELKRAEARTRHFTVIPWLSTINGYLGVKNILERSGPLEDKEFYLCGPKTLKDSIIHQLRQAGVPKRNIYEEEFDFR